jgi:hypothetical protein
MVLFLLSKTVDTVGIRDIFGTYIVTAAAAHTHGVSESFLKIIDLVHDLKPHPLSLVFAVTVSSGHVREAVHLAGSPYPSPLSHIAVVPVKDILHGKTGTGGTDEITAAAADTPVPILFPELQ